MSSSNEIQTNPGETSTPVVQPTTPDTTSVTTTTNNNSDTATISLDKSNKEVDHHNNVDNSTERVALAQHTPETTPTINSATINNGNDKEQPRECMCSGIWYLCCQKKKLEEEGPSSRGQDNSFERRIKKLKKNLDEIEHYLKILEEFPKSDSQEELRTHLKTLKDIVESGKKKPTDSTRTKTPVWIPKISKEIMKFKQQISSTDSLNEKLSLSADLQSSTGSKGGNGVHELGNVHQSASFISSSFYEEIQQIFDGLCQTKKFLLPCFTVFPENAVVKRRICVYWGLGEGMLYASGTNGKNAGEALLHSSGTEEKNTGEAVSVASVTEDKNKSTPEEIVDRILEEFQEKGLIEAITKKRKQREHVKSYKMHPLVRSAVIQISKPAGFFDYDNKGNVLPQRDWASCLDPNKRMREVVENVLLPQCGRMCLLIAEKHEKFLEKNLLQLKGCHH